MSPGGSHETGDQPRRLNKVSDSRRLSAVSTYSCSTSGPGCSHGSCDRNHRTSSRSSGEHHRNHRRRRRSHHDLLQSHHCRSRLPGSSCGQCDRPDRTCSTPGCRHHGLPLGHRRPWCTHERCVQCRRNGSKSSQPEESCTHG
ncbi:hypothetical protein COCC4DRAFT_134750 [Bipolaris maydis ATCC 48331]|uniref:Uncharacterized protein n=2 Tax=Cochliobolus heterostrophus TaxID=5016 RepID=M2UHW5_COCH5|nr:uncharacterized protein COCC4DRAFT_134750 [Bipolaris maydis ATCC 48331]EMD87593.1 hypothetical protein COCHEDRAFT_1159865 [Bipolaris maydis C5]ENI06792.1 hypothetical protein COCC4DRAFT_134750 [Bipolaris maydis ATCC 48331]